jgi:hypothetical protein
VRHLYLGRWCPLRRILPGQAVFLDVDLATYNLATNQCQRDFVKQLHGRAEDDEILSVITDKKVRVEGEPRIAGAKPRVAYRNATKQTLCSGPNHFPLRFSTFSSIDLKRGDLRPSVACVPLAPARRDSDHRASRGRLSNQTCAKPATGHDKICFGIQDPG